MFESKMLSLSFQCYTWCFDLKHWSMPAVHWSALRYNTLTSSFYGPSMQKGPHHCNTFLNANSSLVSQSGLWISNKIRANSSAYTCRHTPQLENWTRKLLKYRPGCSVATARLGSARLGYHRLQQPMAWFRLIAIAGSSATCSSAQLRLKPQLTYQKFILSTRHTHEIIAGLIAFIHYYS